MSWAIKMNYALPFLALFHGLCHFLGLASALQLIQSPRFSMTISKSAGTAWGVVGVLFMLVGGTSLLQLEYTWFLILVAIIPSQLLIVSSWKDAKYGTIVNVILLVWGITGYAAWNYQREFTLDVTANLSQPNYFEKELLTEQDLAPLPEPVQRYIRTTGAVGKPKVNNFRVDFIGKIRSKEQGVWMPFSSRQYDYLTTPTRLFFLDAQMKQLPVAGYHRYVNGRATMDIRLLSIFPVQYAEGVEMNEAETVTFFNDMAIMAPATLIDPRIKWLESDSLKARAALTVNGITIRATLFFRPDGQLINFESFDRYNTEAKQRMRWTTPVKAYGELNGLRLGVVAETRYSYPDGDFSYGEFRMTKVEYNLRSPE